MTVNEALKKQPLLLFDGKCDLCNQAILFFLKHEKNKELHFISIESELGISIKNYFEINTKTDSMILIKNHDAFIKSCAALRLTKYMKGGWPLLIVLVIIPPFIRNFFYDLIARRRKKWFGELENCALLKNEDRSRFLA